jgi:hypothetical protein
MQIWLIQISKEDLELFSAITSKKFQRIDVLEIRGARKPSKFVLSMCILKKQISDGTLILKLD